MRLALIIIGREEPCIEAVDPDDNRRVFLYVDHESGRNTLVPLSEDEYLRYNSIGGRKVFEEKQSYYKDGREKRDEGIMGEDIKRKTMVLKALLYTAKKRRNDCGWLLGGAVFLDEIRLGIERFKPDVEDSRLCQRGFLDQQTQ